MLYRLAVVAAKTMELPAATHAFEAEPKPFELASVIDDVIHHHGGYAISDVLAQAIHVLYAAHRSWSYQLRYDNLVAWAATDGGLGPVPAYATVRRYMKSVGLIRRRKIGGRSDRRHACRAPAR